MEMHFQSRARRGRMEGLLRRIVVFSAIFSISFLNVDGDSVTPSEARQLRDEVRDMFYHAFDGYMQHAFPLDELRPLSCGGEDSLGGYALTLVDSLDTLVLLGDRERFSFAVEWLGKNLRFDIDKTVSVFETTIRVLGGLLSAHHFASDDATGMKIPPYNDELLHLSEDLATRLLPAFETPTGIPYGSVNLLHGVDKYESKITSTAGGGTLTLEFGILSRLTGNPVFEKVTKNAVRGIWARRSELNLVGAHINVFTGEWTQKDAGIGTSIDSFYEYLLKAYLLFGDEEYLYIFQEAYKAAMQYLHSDPWYVEVNMDSAAVVWPLFNSLQAFWPGLQVLAGDIEPAVRTHKAFFSVWKKYGFTPEGFNLATFNVQELSTASRVNGKHILAIQSYKRSNGVTWSPVCNMVPNALVDIVTLWMLNLTSKKTIWKASSLQKLYVFSTEGHLLPLSPEISLVQEHCTYFGAYCRGKDGDRSFSDPLDMNDTMYNTRHTSSKYPPYRGLEEPIVSGLMKGICPGLTHNRKYGLSYVADPEPSLKKVQERQSTYQSRIDFIKSHSVVVISDIDVGGLVSVDDKDNTKISLTTDSSLIDSRGENEYMENEPNSLLSNQSRRSTSHGAS
ncbi:putative alpha-mannosidase I [Nymphaea thermarum]|nr:putative alpha-mannosidase I [Nymphaea thermarum]